MNILCCREEYEYEYGGKFFFKGHLAPITIIAEGIAPPPYCPKIKCSIVVELLQLQ